ncbi:SDR family NAD(P)-dependent oxidoreductase [Lentibacillus sp. L22]|uniref:SDR family NAD(P)-dependent oxidoreductase n=1 Tax=Lentibacillus TaxID=175304 RepID=UPI0022B18EF5|nr:SDR family NAD(P)-dependent oxidoreductase [Lentibacillus daqui]
MLNAVVTGGAQGIGRSIAIKLAEDGYRVFIIDKQQDTGQQTVKEINEKYGEAFFFKMDITNLKGFSGLIYHIL